MPFSFDMLPGAAREKKCSLFFQVKVLYKQYKAFLALTIFFCKENAEQEINFKISKPII